MSDTATPPAPTPPEFTMRQDETLLIFARLMEGGREDEETIADLANLTKLLTQDIERVEKNKALRHQAYIEVFNDPNTIDHERQGEEYLSGLVELGKTGEKPTPAALDPSCINVEEDTEPPVTPVIDPDCVDTMLCYLDLRQPEAVRSHATLCTSAYLKAAGEEGTKNLSDFFHKRMKRMTYDDYIVAFCVAAAIFPIVPDFTAEFFLQEGFLCSLGPLMKRTWKSRKVETACLEMLSAACMHPPCREAVSKYCLWWLEEIANQDTDEAVKAMHSVDTDVDTKEGSISMRRHCKQVQNLAGLVLLKLWTASAGQPAAKSAKTKPASTSIEDLSKRFTEMLVDDPKHVPSSVEGLAYATIQSKVKEELAHDKASLKRLVQVLESAPPKSPLTYGALSVFVHLTMYQPVETEEQKRLKQLKAYANAAGKLQSDPLNDDAHVAARCKNVFEAGITPVLVTHCKHGSAASLTLIISIIFSLSTTPALRGQLAQQGAVRLVLAAWAALPEKEDAARRRAAQALARILISTDPALVFRQTPQSAAIRPLASIIKLDPNAEVRDLLPTFEALLALTNLASTDNDTRRSIVRAAWDDIEEQLFSSNSRVSTAAVELVCNIVQSPEQVLALFGDGSTKAADRIKVILALADAEDDKTRSAAGGALASLTGYDVVVRGVLAQPRGAKIVLDLCRDDLEGLRHRGAVIVHNMISHEGEVGKLAREKLLAAAGVEALTECAKKSRSAEVVQAVVQALEVLLGGDE